jgi:hypothetical protein
MTMFELLNANAVADTELLRKNAALSGRLNFAREGDFAFGTAEHA